MLRFAPSVLAASVIAGGLVLGCGGSEPPVAIDRGGGSSAAPADTSGAGAAGIDTSGGDTSGVGTFGGDTSGAGTSSAGTGASGATRVAYPEPPFGTKTGSIIENLRFLGWQDPAAAGYDPDLLAPLELSRFYDPEGTSGVTFLVITSGAVWCSVCKAEYRELQGGRVAEYGAKGVQFLGVLFEDRSYGPAQPSDLVTWAQQYDVTFNFGLDPAFKMGAFFDRAATPMTLVVDTRTMQILWVGVGWASSGSGSLWSVLDDALASR